MFDSYCRTGRAGRAQSGARLRSAYRLWAADSRHLLHYMTGNRRAKLLLKGSSRVALCVAVQTCHTTAALKLCSHAPLCGLTMRRLLPAAAAPAPRGHYKHCAGGQVGPMGPGRSAGGLRGLGSAGLRASQLHLICMPTVLGSTWSMPGTLAAVLPHQMPARCSPIPAAACRFLSAPQAMQEAVAATAGPSPDRGTTRFWELPDAGHWQVVLLPCSRAAALFEGCCFYEGWLSEVELGRSIL